MLKVKLLSTRYHRKQVHRSTCTLYRSIVSCIKTKTSIFLNLATEKKSIIVLADGMPGKWQEKKEVCAINQELSLKVL